MKTLTALILAVFVCVLGHFFSKWCGVSYEDFMIGGLAFLHFRLATILATRDEI